ncbi:MAG: hypothetical protein AAF215_24325 [Cyanobacteria bacterium P01_A01_bin.123]
MSSQITLNLLEGSVRMSFSVNAARELKAALGDLVSKLKAIALAKSGRSGAISPQKPMEFRHAGEIFLEVFCNPNIWPSPFAAKVLLTVRDDRIRLSTEAELTRLIEDVNQYLEQVD